MTVQNGVQFNQPPEEMIPRINNAIKNSFEHLPKDAKGGVFTVFDGKGANVAVAVRAPKGIEVITYIGKTWNKDGYIGVNARKIWY